MGSRMRQEKEGRKEGLEVDVKGDFPFQDETEEGGRWEGSKMKLKEEEGVKV